MGRARSRTLDRGGREAVGNAAIAEALDTVGDLLELEGANPFRVRAYRTGARVVRDLPRSAAALVAEGKDLAELHGIGRDLAGKIEEMVETGRLSFLEEVKARVPPALAELVDLPVLGPKRAKALHDALGVTTVDELADAVRAGRLRGLKGFGPRTEERLLEELERRRGPERRMPIAEAEAVAGPLLEYLRGARGVRECVVAGSYRRRKETVRDLDVLVACSADSDIVERLVASPDVDEVVAQGTTRSTVVLRSGVHVDLRVVPEESYGAALHYFTGSKAHNIAVRTLAVRRGLKLNEYGVFRGEERIAGRSEEEVYAQVELPYIEPELREGRGEIEAAAEGRLPALVTRSDLRGDLHVHTPASDGTGGLEELARAAASRGYEYLAVTDHGPGFPGRRKLTLRRLREQLEEIDRLNAELEGVVLLKAVEAEIHEDGAIDLADEVLATLDLVVAGIHSAFDLPREAQTARVLRALEHPRLAILAHPTGRLLNGRPPLDLDLERVLEAAREHGCALELNARPERLDLDDLHCRLAKEMGVTVAISTDAHSPADLDLVRFGVDQARRGWLGPEDVLNTRSLEELRSFLAGRATS